MPKSQWSVFKDERGDHIIMDRFKDAEDGKTTSQFLAQVFSRAREYSPTPKEVADRIVKSVNALPVIAKLWDEYTTMLKEKYPAPEGEEWKFTCEFHQKIDGLIKEVTNAGN